MTGKLRSLLMSKDLIVQEEEDSLVETVQDVSCLAVCGFMVTLLSVHA